MSCCAVLLTLAIPPPTHTQYRNAASHDAELDFFEIYMGPMTTLYSEVRGGGTVCKASVSLKGLILCLPSPAFTPAFTHTPLPHPPPSPPDLVEGAPGTAPSPGYRQETGRERHRDRRVRRRIISYTSSIIIYTPYTPFIHLYSRTYTCLHPLDTIYTSYIHLKHPQTPHIRPIYALYTPLYTPL